MSAGFAIVVDWFTDQGYPLRTTAHTATAFELRQVLGFQYDYKVERIWLTMTPRYATGPASIHYSLARFSGGDFRKRECFGDIELCHEAKPGSRVQIDDYGSRARSVSMAGGGFAIAGPFPAHGLMLFVSSDVSLAGRARIELDRPPLAADRDAEPPSESTEPECRCESLLWGHERSCGLYRQ